MGMGLSFSTADVFLTADILFNRRAAKRAKFLFSAFSAVNHQKKGRAAARPYYFTIHYFTISLLKNDVPHRHCSPTRIINGHVVHSCCAPRVDIDIRLLTVDCV